MAKLNAIALSHCAQIFLSVFIQVCKIANVGSSSGQMLSGFKLTIFAIWRSGFSFIFLGKGNEM